MCCVVSLLSFSLRQIVAGDGDGEVETYRPLVAEKSRCTRNGLLFSSALHQPTGPMFQPFWHRVIRTVLRWNTLDRRKLHFKSSTQWNTTTLADRRKRSMKMKVKTTQHKILIYINKIRCPIKMFVLFFLVLHHLILLVLPTHSDRSLSHTPTNKFPISFWFDFRLATLPSRFECRRHIYSTVIIDHTFILNSIVSNIEPKTALKNRNILSTIGNLFCFVQWEWMRRQSADKYISIVMRIVCVKTYARINLITLSQYVAFPFKLSKKQIVWIALWSKSVDLIRGTRLEEKFDGVHQLDDWNQSSIQQCVMHSIGLWPIIMV